MSEQELTETHHAIKILDEIPPTVREDGTLVLNGDRIIAVGVAKRLLAEVERLRKELDTARLDLAECRTKYDWHMSKWQERQRSYAQNQTAHTEQVERLRAENADLLDKNAEMGALMLAAGDELVNVHGPRVARLEAENAALRPIVERVIVGERVSFGSVEGTVCEWCRLTWRSVDMQTTLPPHTPDCPVRRARALLARYALSAVGGSPSDSTDGAPGGKS